MSKLRETKGEKFLSLLEKNSVPLFYLIGILGIPLSGYSLGYLGQEIVVVLHETVFNHCSFSSNYGRDGT